MIPSSKPRGFRWRNLLAALFYAAFSLALLAPMASDLPTSANDLRYHLAVIVQARLAIDQGQFPLRIAPYSFNGWGYPLFQFYSQVPFTLAGLVYEFVSPGNPYVAYKLVLWLALTLGGFFLFRLAFWFTRSRVASLLAGIIYIAAPYLLINLHARGDFAEAFAQGILPLVLFASLRCYVTRSPYWFVASGLCWFALATSHVVTFFYSALFAALLFLLLGVASRRKIERLFQLGAAFILGCLLSAYFLAPDFLGSYMRVRDLVWPPYSFNWLTPLPALLSPTSLPPEPQPGQLTTPFLYPAVGWPMLIAACTVAYFLVFERTLTRSITTRAAGGLVALFGIALFVTWSPVDFWSLLPEPLRIVQFPYRMLTQVMWTGALLSSYAITWLFRGRLDGRHAIAGLLLVGLAAGPYLPAPRSASFRLSDIVARPDLIVDNDIVLTDYLAKTDLYSPNPYPQDKLITVSETQALCQHQGQETLCTASVPSGSVLVQLPVLYYPDLLGITVNGQQTEYSPTVDQDFVLAAVRLSAGSHEIRVKFQGLEWANWTSLAAWLGAILILVLSVVVKRPIRFKLRALWVGK